MDRSLAGGVDPYVETILLQEGLNVTLVLVGSSAGLAKSRWMLGANGDLIEWYFLGDSSNSYENEAIFLYFDPPVTTVVMQTNYDPIYPDRECGPPTFTVLTESGTEVGCYNIGSLAPISTPGGVNAGATRGVTRLDGIAGLKLDGGQIVAWDIDIVRNGVAPQAPIEPPMMDAPVEAPVAAGPQAAPSAAPVTTNTPAKQSDAVTIASSAALVCASLLLL